MTRLPFPTGAGRQRPCPRPFACLALVCSLTACTAGGEPTGQDVGYRADLVGTLWLVEESGDYGIVHTNFYRGAIEGETLQLVERRGDCAVWTRVPGCLDCRSLVGAGMITVTGIDPPLVLELEDGHYGSPQFAADFFDASTVFHVSATGGEIRAFEADVQGVSALVPGALDVDAFDDADTVLSWTASAEGARIQVSLRTGLFGTPYTAQLVCETEDDGSLTIPADLLAHLPESPGGTAVHESWIRRFRRTWLDIGAPAELFVASSWRLDFSHAAARPAP